MFIINHNCSILINTQIMKSLTAVNGMRNTEQVFYVCLFVFFMAETIITPTNRLNSRAVGRGVSLMHGYNKHTFTHTQKVQNSSIQSPNISRPSLSHLLITSTCTFL